MKTKKSFPIKIILVIGFLILLSIHTTLGIIKSTVEYVIKSMEK